MRLDRQRLTVLVVVAAFGVGCKGPDKESVEYRADLYEGCAQCHGPQGLGLLPPTPEDPQGLGVPAIAGLERWYVKSQLRKFRNGHRGWHPDDLAGRRMYPMSLALPTDEDVALVSAYVASLPRTKPQPILEGGDATRGKVLYTPCVTCHGPNAAGDLEQRAPPLNHASDWYLYSQLKKFKAGMRGTHPEDVTGAKMQPFAMTLPDEQAMKDVVAHIMTLQDQQQ